MKLSDFLPFKSVAPVPTQDRALPASLPGFNDNTQTSFYQPFALYNGNLISTTDLSTQVVTQQGVLGLPAAWAAVNMIAHASAMMLASGDVYGPDGTELQPTPPQVAKPNAMYGSGYEFWFEVVTTLLIYGNYVGLIYNGQVVPVHPSHVECRISSEGLPVYRIGSEVYANDDVLHVRGLTMPGTWWGLGVIEAQRRTLAASVNMQTFAGTTYSTGAVPTAVIKLDAKNVPQDILTQVGQDWQNSFSNGNRKPVVLPQGIDVMPLSWSPEDAQFLQSRQFNVAEVALMFGLNPADLSATIGGQSLTYANISEVNMERIKRSYAPWVVRVEQAWCKLLPDGYCFTASPEALLRMDTKSRYESYQIALSAGWLTVDEVRAFENLQPMGTPTPSDQPLLDDPMEMMP